MLPASVLESSPLEYAPFCAADRILRLDGRYGSSERLNLPLRETEFTIFSRLNCSYNMHSSINFLTIVFACLVAVGLYGQQTKVEFTEFELDNGLKVLLHQDDTAPIVAVSVMYHVGSKNEEKNRTGFAHFFEHLMFEGSENIDRGEFGDYVTNAGGVLNANTSYDRTYYFEILPSNELELALWLESERMLHAKVDSVGIETQREVVKEERRQRIDNVPYGTVLQNLGALAFEGTPYSWPVIGFMEDLNAASDDDYVNFYKKFYVPNNAILSIAGDLDIEQTKALVEQYFGSIPAGEEIQRPKIGGILLGQTIRDTVYDNIQLPLVAIGYRIPPQGTDDYYALSMLNKVLSDGQSSRLYKTLVDERQLALQVGSIPLALEDIGLALGFGIANQGVNSGEMEEAMIEIMENAGNDLISEREFQKLKNQIESDFINQLASVSGIAENLATYEMFFGDAGLINEEIERFRAVTREDIQRVAKKYLNSNNRVILTYLPKAQP